MKKNEKLENKVRDLIADMRDKSLVDFMRSADREMVVKEIVEFIKRQSKLEKKK